MADGVTGWTADGNNLRTKGYNIQSRPQWEGMGGLRGGPLEVAYMDGVQLADGLPYRENVLTFEMLIWGRNPTTGAIDTTNWEHLEDNLDAVKGIFSTGSEIDLRRTMASGDIRQVLGRCYTGVPARRVVQGGEIILLPVGVLVPEGTYRDITGGTAGESDTSNTALSGSGNFALAVGGNAHTAPVITVDATSTVSDFSLTFPDGAVLAYNDEGATIPASSQLIIDCAAREVTLDGSPGDVGLSSAKRSYWAWLDGGGSNTIAYSSSAGTFDIGFAWYDRWR